MSSLSKKLLKDCKKHSDAPKRKLTKKLLSHELELSAIMPLLQQLADTSDKQQQTAEMLIQLLAPKASPAQQQALAVQLQALGFGDAAHFSSAVESAAPAPAIPDKSAKKPAKKTGKLKLVPANDSFASKPFKSKPCSSCPALRGGLCKCALKRASKQRPQISDQPKIVQSN